MKTDIEPERIKGLPTKSAVLLSGVIQNQGFVIRKIELRQYIERKDVKLGDYSLFTVVVDTDKGAVEMKYDEGFRGADALDLTVKMLMRHVGLSALINRALIALLE
jgi:hypothetical protein